MISLPLDIQEYIKNIISGSPEFWKIKFQKVLDQIVKIPTIHYTINWYLKGSLYVHLEKSKQYIGRKSSCVGDRKETKVPSYNNYFVNYIYDKYWDKYLKKYNLTKNYLKYEYKPSSNNIYDLSKNLSFFLWGRDYTEIDVLKYYHINSISKK